MNATNLIIKGLLSEMSPESQARVAAAAEKFRAILGETKATGEGALALALVASELEE